ncbi:heterokaryon incompatibility protein-domain-containing protein [Cubamyces lactineus]|nr:heterokaryon incompatibility protein-domain-containing protein [Cubamyces lactineus]
MALPPRPHNICALAWESVFAAQFGIKSDDIRVKKAHKDSPDGRESQRLIGGCGYTVSLAAWLQCARSGCLWCRFLDTHFLDDISSQLSAGGLVPDEKVHVRVGCRQPIAHRQRKPLFSGVLDIIVKYRETIITRVYNPKACADDPAAAYIEDRMPIPRVGAPQVLAMAKAWMEECASSHEVCQQTRALHSAPWLPTRLIDCSDTLRVRLIQTRDDMHGARYIALSYVWGVRLQSYQTTSDNLESYTNVGIAVAQLPRTIRDAIHVTHALGVDLLWLDSLCIVQDSPEDKHRELASMCKVYRHAHLVINAASAASVSEGFLQDRPLPDPGAALPFICPVRAENIDRTLHTTRVGTVYLRNEMLEDIYYDEHPLRYETKRRGWCLQEGLLSTRSLVFNPDTLSLSCQMGHSNVGCSRRAMSEPPFVTLPLYDVIPVTGPPILPGSDEWKAIRYRWLVIVENYSNRLLSYREDKLLACAAIAEVFAPHLGPIYAAGLWRDTLLEDLLWESKGRCSGRQRPREHPYAPSWSWASTDHGITYETWREFVMHHPMVEVLECNVVPQDDILRFGSVQPGGHLGLRAVLLPCEWDGAADADGLRLVVVKLQQNPTSCDTHTLSVGPRASWVEVLQVVRLDYDGDDDELHDVCIVLLTALESDIRGLVVARTAWSIRRSAELAKGDVYERVGFWKASRSTADRYDVLRRFCENEASPVGIVLV